jgi:hypothetical protein
LPFDQLLHRERRTEVRIVLANQGQHRVAKGLATFAIARTTALPGNQSRCATGLKGSTKPENLAPANTHQRASRRQCEPTIPQVNHHTQSAQFPIAHLDHRHRMSP